MIELHTGEHILSHTKLHTCTHTHTADEQSVHTQGKVCRERESQKGYRTLKPQTKKEYERICPRVRETEQI